MTSLYSNFGFMWYWKELTKIEFMNFKELLILEILQMGLNRISFAEVNKASREDLAILLVKYCEGNQAWDTTFKVLQMIGRKDLTERVTKEIAAHPTIYRTHLKEKMIHGCSRKFNISIQNFFQDEYDHLENLLIPEETEEKPQTVFLKGVAGIGKSILLKNLMIVWSEGLVFQKFSYMFYFCCQDVEQLHTASLAELISREWPSPSAPIEEILSQPEKLLFIIDNLEGMEWDFTEQESELCYNCMEKQPVNVLLSSLLRRKILPKSSLLISASCESFEELKDWIEYTSVRTITGFKESNIKMYFYSFFQDSNKAEEVFSLVRKNEQLFTVCQAPVVCCMVATCLKNEIERGKDPVPLCHRITSLYTSYILNLFTPPNAQNRSENSQVQLKGLCFLAVEGMWTGTSVFNEVDLESNGITDSDIPTLLDTGILEQSRGSENCYIFIHPSVQEYCAAMFYLIQTSSQHSSEDVHSLEPFLFTFLKEDRTHWIFLGRFFFGLLRKLELEKLKAFFGYHLSNDLKHELFFWLESLCDTMDPSVKINNSLKFFYCLFEIEERYFVQSAMNCMEEINVVVKDYSDLVVAAFCLGYGSAMRDLSISTQNVLNEDLDQSKTLLKLWHKLCTTFLRNRDMEILQMKDTIFTEKVFQILYNYLKNSSCILEKLVLANCSLSEPCWKYLLKVLRQNKNLTYLGISSSDLKDEGLKVLCRALTLPDGILITLCVNSCLITTRGCQDLAEVIRNNKNLKILNVSENKLEDSGVKLLCDALKHPTCKLEQLNLEACHLTGACCEDLASTFTQCTSLRYINLIKNTLDFNGLVVLCKALKEQTSAVRELRLQLTDFDIKSQAFLLSENERNKFLRIKNVEAEAETESGHSDA